MSICFRTFNWRGKDGQSTVITLQHDRNGKMRFLCRACNTHHAGMPGDLIYILKSDEKYCPKCIVDEAYKIAEEMIKQRKNCEK